MTFFIFLAVVKSRSANRRRSRSRTQGERSPTQSRDNARATARRHLDLARDIDYEGSRPNGKNGT